MAPRVACSRIKQGRILLLICKYSERLFFSELDWLGEFSLALAFAITSRVKVLLLRMARSLAKRACCVEHIPQT